MTVFEQRLRRTLICLLEEFYGRSAYLGRAASRRIWEVDGQTSLYYDEEVLVVGGLVRPDHEVSVISRLA